MSVRKSAPATRFGVPPVVIVIVAVLALAFAGWRAWATFAPPSDPKLPPPPAAEISFIDQKARESHGDFSKLSQADQAQVQKITHGFGPASMASTWREIQQGRAH